MVLLLPPITGLAPMLMFTPPSTSSCSRVVRCRLSWQTDACHIDINFTFVAPFQ